MELFTHGIAGTATGDGAGILVAIPQTFFIRATAELGIDLPPRNYYGIGMVFLPTDDEQRRQAKALIEKVCARRRRAAAAAGSCCALSSVCV